MKKLEPAKEIDFLAIQIIDPRTMSNVLLYKSKADTMKFKALRFIEKNFKNYRAFSRSCHIDIDGKIYTLRCRIEPAKAGDL